MQRPAVIALGEDKHVIWSVLLAFLFKTCITTLVRFRPDVSKLDALSVIRDWLMMAWANEMNQCGTVHADANRGGNPSRLFSFAEVRHLSERG